MRRSICILEGVRQALETSEEVGYVFLVIVIDIVTKTRYVIHIFTSSATPSSSPDWQLPSFFQQSALNHQFVKYFVNNNIKPRSVSNNPARLVQFFLQGDNIVGQPAHHYSSLVFLYHSALQVLSNYLAVKVFCDESSQPGNISLHLPDDGTCWLIC